MSAPEADRGDEAERNRRDLAELDANAIAEIAGASSRLWPDVALAQGWGRDRQKAAIAVLRVRELRRSQEQATDQGTVDAFGSDDDQDEANVIPIHAGRKRKPRPAAVAPASDDDREHLKISANTHEVTAAMCVALSEEPGIYHRDRKLVNVVAAEEVTSSDGTVLVAAGTPQPRELPLSSLIDVISRRRICLSYDARAGGFLHKAPPKDRVRAVLEKGSWPGVPELVGVSETPFMAPSGRLIQEPGYDPETRYLYAPSEHFDVVPHEPTWKQAVAALAALTEAYCDYPYVNESHRSAAMTLPITLVARPAISGPVPAYIFDASVKRSGKTKQVDSANIIATGRPAGRSIFPSAKNADELAKVMAGHAQAGTPLIFFDNVPQYQVFGGPVLDAWITAEGRVNYRTLGKTGDSEVEYRSVIAASGNGIECGEDLAPRVLAPRLESPLENPELRTGFKHDPLLPWVKANRARLVVAILTLLRAYVVAGRPEMKIPRWGSFEAFTGLIASAMVWAGAADPTGARKAEAGDDPQLAAERVLVGGWTGLANETGKSALTAAQFITQLYAPRKAETSPLDVTPIREAVEFLTRTKPGCAPDAKHLGKVLRGLKHRNIRGQMITTDGDTGGVARWLTKRAGA